MTRPSHAPPLTTYKGRLIFWSFWNSEMKLNLANWIYWACACKPAVEWRVNSRELYSSARPWPPRSITFLRDLLYPVFNVISICFFQGFRCHGAIVSPQAWKPEWLWLFRNLFLPGFISRLPADSSAKESRLLAPCISQALSTFSFSSLMCFFFFFWWDRIAFLLALSLSPSIFFF